MRVAARLITLSTLALVSIDASAHGSAKGLGNFFGGFVHPLLEPAHVVSLVAFALLIGPRLDALKPTVLWLAGGSILGGLGVALGVKIDTDTPLLVGAALVGLAVVIAKPLPGPVYRIGALGLGLGIGFGSLADDVTGATAWVMLAGSCLGAPAFALNFAMLVQAMKKPWMQILIRVFGSWAAACSILVLSLVLSGRSLNSISGPPPAVDAAAPLDVQRN